MWFCTKDAISRVLIWRKDHLFMFSTFVTGCCPTVLLVCMASYLIGKEVYTLKRPGYSCKLKMEVAMFESFETCHHGWPSTATDFTCGVRDPSQSRQFWHKVSALATSGFTSHLCWERLGQGLSEEDKIFSALVFLFHFFILWVETSSSIVNTIKLMVACFYLIIWRTSKR